MATLLTFKLQHKPKQKWLFLDVSDSWAWFPPSREAVVRANKGWTRVSVTWLGFWAKYAAKQVQSNTGGFISNAFHSLSNYGARLNPLDGVLLRNKNSVFPWGPPAQCKPLPTHMELLMEEKNGHVKTVSTENRPRENIWAVALKAKTTQTQVYIQEYIIFYTGELRRNEVSHHEKSRQFGIIS